MRKRFAGSVIATFLAVAPSHAEVLAVIDSVSVQDTDVSEFSSREADILDRESGGTAKIPERLRGEIASASLGDIVSGVILGEAARKAGLATEAGVIPQMKEAGKGKLGRIDEDIFLGYLWSSRKLQQTSAQASEDDLRKFWDEISTGAAYTIKIASFTTKREAEQAREVVNTKNDFDQLGKRPGGEGRPLIGEPTTDTAFLWRWKYGLLVDGAAAGDIRGPSRAKNGMWDLWLIQDVSERKRITFDRLGVNERDLVRENFASHEANMFFDNLLKKTKVEWKTKIPDQFTDAN